MINIMGIKLKMKVGTGLDSRWRLVSIIFADLTSLYPPSFDFYTCVQIIIVKVAKDLAL